MRLLRILALALALLMALPMAAQATPDSADARRQALLEHVRRLDAGGGAAVAPPGRSGGSSYQALGCVDDPAADTVLINYETGDERPQSDPRADIVRACVDLTGTSVILDITVVQPTNPSSDPRWRGLTGMYWGFDTNADGDVDFFAIMDAYETGRLTTSTASVQRDATGEPVDVHFTCSGEGRPALRGATYSTGAIPSGCIGSPSNLRFYSNFVYDTDARLETFVVVEDYAPQPPAYSGQITSGANPPTKRPTARIAGATRVETAIQIARTAFPQTSTAVYLARADLFADAIAAGSLTDGPVLLTDRCATPEAVRQEVARLQPQTVTALGGRAAVCDAALAAASGGRPTNRLAGDDRFGTAAAVAARAFPQTATTVYLANGGRFADAVAGGTLTDGPVLLSHTCQLPQVTADAIARLRPQRVVALGGTQALCDAVLAQAAGGRPSSRLAGPGRIETAVEIAQAQFPQTATTVYLAESSTFADAVAAGSLTDGPVLLVPTAGPLPRAVREEVVRLDPRRVVALGGRAAVSEDILRQAADA